MLRSRFAPDVRICGDYTPARWVQPNFRLGTPAHQPCSHRRMTTLLDDDILLDSYSRAVTSAAARITPSVVNVGGGSGFFFTPDGFILTNSHVVERKSSVDVTTTDGSRFHGTVVGDDP